MGIESSLAGNYRLLRCLLGNQLSGMNFIGNSTRLPFRVRIWICYLATT